MDGRVNEVQGVYVKSVAEVGDGKKKVMEGARRGISEVSPSERMRFRDCV